MNPYDKKRITDLFVTCDTLVTTAQKGKTLEDRALDFGILIAVNVITKRNDEIKNAQSILTGYLRKHIQIIVIDREDILQLNDTTDMVTLIKNKICELVVNG